MSDSDSLPGSSNSSEESSSSDEQEEESLDLKKNTILEQVTRNTLVRAIWHVKMKSSSRGAGDTESFKAIYETMTMQELQVERAYMRRMGFMEVMRLIDDRIEKIRSESMAERGVLEKQLIETRLKGLERAQAQRIRSLDTKLERERQDMFQKFAQEESAMIKKHQRAYTGLVEETANRATGGILQGNTETAHYMSKQNKSASYKTRKPSHDVIRYRKSAQRLREMGRREEALAFEAKAAKMDEEAEVKWRNRVSASITSSAWGGAKSKLEQLIDQQQKELKRLKQEHDAKLAWIDQKHELQRTTIKRTMIAERTKVVTLCKKQAKKRLEADAQERLQEARARKRNSGKSDGMNNISKNILSTIVRRSSEDSDEEDEKQEEDVTALWVAPKTFGLEHSAPLIQTDGNVAEGVSAQTTVGNQDLSKKLAYLAQGGGTGTGMAWNPVQSTTAFAEEEEEEEEEQGSMNHLEPHSSHGEDEDQPDEENEWERDAADERRQPDGENELERDAEDQRWQPDGENEREREDERRQLDTNSHPSHEKKKAEPRARLADSHTLRNPTAGSSARKDKARPSSTSLHSSTWSAGHVPQSSSEKDSQPAASGFTPLKPQRPPMPTARPKSTADSRPPTRPMRTSSQIRNTGADLPQRPRTQGSDTRTAERGLEPENLDSAHVRMLVESFLPLAWACDYRGALRSLLRGASTRYYLLSAFSELGVGTAAESFCQMMLASDANESLELAQAGEYLGAEQMLALIYLPVLLQDQLWRTRLISILQRSGSAKALELDLAEPQTSEASEVWTVAFLASVAKVQVPIVLCSTSDPLAPSAIYANTAAQDLIGLRGEDLRGKQIPWLDPAITSFVATVCKDDDAQWFHRRSQTFGPKGDESDILYSWVPVRNSREQISLGVLLLLPVSPDDRALRQVSLEALYQLAAVTMLTPKETQPPLPQVFASVENTWSVAVAAYNELIRELTDLYYEPKDSLLPADLGARHRKAWTLQARLTPLAAACRPSEALDVLLSDPDGISLLKHVLEPLGVGKLVRVAAMLQDLANGTAQVPELFDRMCGDRGLSPDQWHRPEGGEAAMEQQVRLEAEGGHRLLSTLYLPVLLASSDFQDGLVAVLERGMSVPVDNEVETSEAEAWSEGFARLVADLDIPVVVYDTSRASIAPEEEAHSGRGKPLDSARAIWGNGAVESLFAAEGSIVGHPRRWLEERVSWTLPSISASRHGGCTRSSHRRGLLLIKGSVGGYDCIFSWAPIRDASGRSCRAVLFILPLTAARSIREKLYQLTSLLLLVPRSTAPPTVHHTTAKDPRPESGVGVSGTLNASIGALNEILRVLVDQLYPPFPPKGSIVDPTLPLDGGLHMVKSRVLPPSTHQDVSEAFLPLAWFSSPERTLRKLLEHGGTRVVLEGFCNAAGLKPLFEAATSADSEDQPRARQLLAFTYLPQFLSNPDWLDLLLATLRSRPATTPTEARADATDAWAASFVHVAPSLAATTVLVEVGDANGEGVGGYWVGSQGGSGSAAADLSLIWLQQDEALSRALRMSKSRVNPTAVDFLSSILAPAQTSANPVLHTLEHGGITHGGVALYEKGFMEPLVNCLSSWVPIRNQTGDVRYVVGLISVVATQDMIGSVVNGHASLVHLLPKRVLSPGGIPFSPQSSAELEQTRRSLLAPPLQTFVAVL